MHDIHQHQSAEFAASLRSLRARYAALIRHSRSDSSEITLPARQAFMARFEREADPNGALSERERPRRAELLRRAFFVDLARRSVEARAKKRRRLAGLPEPE